MKIICSCSPEGVCILDIKLKAYSWSCSLKEGFGVFKMDRKKPNMAADSHGGEECLRYREGSLLYVTHFLYHIPRLCCASTFSLFGTNSFWQSSQFNSMSSAQRAVNCTFSPLRFKPLFNLKQI